MPREGATGRRTDERGTTGTRPGRRPVVLELTDELAAALRPWLDVTEVGAVGVRAWLLSVLPLLPKPGSGDHVLDRDSSRGSAEERLERLARALAECAGDRARSHFQAAEYFRENRVLARRVKALEAIVRTRAEATGSRPAGLDDPEATAATERYLPAVRK